MVLQTLLTISENLLREPDNPKFQQFKPTNNIVKRDLVDPKGTLEYAIEVSGVSPSPFH
jgi:PUB domain